MSARWYKRCGADFMHGTMMLTLEEKGAYSLCLDLIYDRGGPIPDDARWLSGVCGVSMRKWSALRQRLVDLGKLSAENGLLSNSRAALELVSAELSSRERAETGAKGGRKRAENAASAKKSNGLGQAELKPKEEIREEEKEGEAAPHCARATPQPVAEAHQAWNETASMAGWPVAVKLSATRRASLNARLREHGLEGWRAAITRARASPYLGHDPPSWFTFDWLLKPANFLKLSEGNYDRRLDENRGSGGRMGGPRPDPTLAIVRAARAAQPSDAGDRGETRFALPAG
jgi:uncharacterized protein YdaU (DUF1376 family)